MQVAGVRLSARRRKNENKFSVVTCCILHMMCCIIEQWTSQTKVGNQFYRRTVAMLLVSVLLALSQVRPIFNKDIINDLLSRIYWRPVIFPVVRPTSSKDWRINRVLTPVFMLHGVQYNVIRSIESYEMTTQSLRCRLVIVSVMRRVRLCIQHHTRDKNTEQ